MTKDDILDIISDSGYCLFSTVEGSQPRVRPLAPYYNADDNNLLVALVPGSRTLEQIKINPLVEMCFVDRKMSFCRLSGKAKQSDVLAKKELLWNNVPNLRQYFDGPKDPNFSLIEIDVKSVEAMSMELQNPISVDF